MEESWEAESREAGRSGEERRGPGKNGEGRREGRIGAENNIHLIFLVEKEK